VMPESTENGTTRPGIGVIMLDTRFPRPPGDIGNPASFDFPVIYRVVPGAAVTRVVHGKAVDPALLSPFVEAAQALEKEGVRGIATSCGFLSVFQADLAAAVRVPVVTSSLLLLPLIRAMVGPERTIGVVTANAESFSKAQIDAVGASSDDAISVTGMESCDAFARSILADSADMPLDGAAIKHGLITAAQGLTDDSQNLGAVLLECTNLVPYASDLQRALKVPVFSIHTAISLLHQGLMPPRFGR